VIRVDSIAALTEQLQHWKDKRFTLGLVPTMGFFHEGHLALMRKAKSQCDKTVVTIFVNPRQFGPQEDLQLYPRDFEGDVAKARQQGVDLLFSPDPQEMYPDGYQTSVSVAHLSQGLCGTSRPGHFDGVATVVAKLFNLVRPKVAVFGQKDYQQLALLQQMNSDLHFGVEIIAHPIVREEDGLAMSSRNKYLTPLQRQKAVGLFEALQHAAGCISETASVPASILITAVERKIMDIEDCVIDYIAVVDALTLRPKENAEPGDVIALAAFFGGKVRLIDNITL